MDCLRPKIEQFRPRNQTKLHDWIFVTEHKVESIVKLKQIAVAASAALVLASTAGVAQASSAQSLSLKNSGAVRAASSSEKSNEAVGGFLIPLLAVLAIAGGILIISNDSDSN